jgi:hypothetical protein
MVGRTPWSARVPQDPLLCGEMSFIQSQRADEGVGCGPGGPPHEASESRLWKTKWYPAAGCQPALVRRRERSRNVIVPGQGFFVHQSPQETQTRGAEAERTRGQAMHPLGAGGPLTVEIYQR